MDATQLRIVETDRELLRSIDEGYKKVEENFERWKHLGTIGSFFALHASVTEFREELKHYGRKLD